MSIRKWHWGKLIILWCWGGLVAALALTHFMGAPVADTPLLHGSELIFVIVTLLVLSAITWHWLGSKEAS
jgi:hypothetical protein